MMCVTPLGLKCSLWQKVIPQANEYAKYQELQIVQHAPVSDHWKEPALELVDTTRGALPGATSASNFLIWADFTSSVFVGSTCSGQPNEFEPENLKPTRE
jgi:hypothetical protein